MNTGRAESKKLMTQKLIAKKRTALVQYKSLCGCVVCGATDTDFLDFHHHEPDQDYISLSNLAKKTVAEITRQLSNLVVLCANHHRKTHARLERGEPTELPAGHYDSLNWIGACSFAGLKAASSIPSST